MKAYKEDLSSNPDLTGSSIVDIAKQKNADIIVKKEEKKDKPPNQLPEKKTKWYEAKSKDGVSYYYHSETKGEVSSLKNNQYRNSNN